LSLAYLPLYAFTLLFIGRLHELVPVLESMRLVLVVSLAATASALLIARTSKHVRIWNEREVRLVLSLYVLAVLLAPFSVWPGVTLAFITRPFFLVVLFFLLIVTVAASRQVMTGLVLSLLVAAAMLGAFTLSEAAIVGEGRAYASKMYDPNDLAMVIDCILPFAALGAFALRGPARWLAMATTALGAIAVVKTLSRGGFIGLIVVAVLLLLRWRAVRLTHRVTGLLVAAIAVSVFLPADYWYAMGTILNLVPPDDASYLESGILARTEIWMQGLMIFRNHALLGTGAGAFEIAEGLSHGGEGKWSAAHNSFIEIGSELGIAGLAIFVALLVISIRNARAAARAAHAHPELSRLVWIATATELSLYTYMVTGFALSQAYSPVVYFLFALATALRLQVRRHTTATAAPVAANPVRRRIRSS
jgi:O-antigen ligase